jgi:hypothetical protein
MSVKDQFTYKWVRDNGQLSVTRTIVGDAGGALDFAVANGAQRSPASLSLVVAKLNSLIILCDQAVTLYAGGTNAAQTLSMTGPPTAGTFTITLGAATSAAIAYNATAAAVQAALEAMSTIGTGGVACTGGPLPGTPVVATFQGANAVQPIATMTTTDTLTGGSSSFASTTTGVAPDKTISILANDPLVWDSQGYFACPFTVDVSTIRVTNASGSSCTLQVRSNSNA